MKRILLAITILFSFIIVEAQVLFPYGEASGKAGSYSNLVEEYNTYFVNMNQTNPSNKIPYAYTKNAIGINNNFTINGLVNNDEYILSTKENKYDTYLYTGSDYWTMGGSCINQYGLSVTCERNNSIRPTEYVKKGIRITGSGTYIDPWTFRKTKFNVTFVTYGGTLNKDITKISAIYDETYSELEGLTANKVGYNFVCWTLVPNSETCILPTTRVTAIEDHVLFAKYEAKTDTRYIVNNYIENIGIAEPGEDLSNYTLNNTETKVGTTDAVVPTNTTVIPGFTLKAQSSQTINGDGSTVVNYLYTRNKYGLSLLKDGNTASVIGAGTYDYGESVNISCTPASNNMFNYWEKTSGLDPLNFNTSINNQTIQMPASNVTLKAYSKLSYTFAFTYTGGVYAPGFTNNGGLYSTENTNWLVKFTSSGTLSVIDSATNVDIFVVGGGASGYSGQACLYGAFNGHSATFKATGGTGGGGGQYTTQKNKTFSFNTNYAVAVGAGGIGLGTVENNAHWCDGSVARANSGGGSSITGTGISISVAGGSVGGGGVGAWQTPWNTTTCSEGANSTAGWNGTYPFGDTLSETVIYGSTGGGGGAHAAGVCTRNPSAGGSNAGAGGNAHGTNPSNCNVFVGANGNSNTGGGGGGGGAIQINASNINQCRRGEPGGNGGSGVVMIRNAR